MNTKCPQCGTAYNVTEAHIGRKVKCKNCSASMIVTERGLELKSRTGAVPTSPPPAGEFEFDDPGRAEPEPERAGRSRGRRRDEPVDEPPADDEDYRAESRRGRRRRSSGNFGEILAFRKMITPVVIQTIFWVLTAVIILAGLVQFVISLVAGGGTALILIAAAQLIIGVPIGILIIRIYCEVLIVFFRVYDTLTEIKQSLDRQSGGGGASG